ncbi:MAG: dUTP diphosphatase [Bacillaceae bacterium]|nr:dUTP diphosphatase [Bacillaceae bacterium]
MNWDKLYEMQSELDGRIKKQHRLEGKDVFDEKVLALLVEVGELANETRCFKFWSTKGPNEQSVILEEFVDGLHFILSLGIEKGYFVQMVKAIETEGNQSITRLFLSVYSQIEEFRQESTMNNYEKLCMKYLELGKFLGFSPEMIEHAYMEKNEVNHERQNQGY